MTTGPHGSPRRLDGTCVDVTDRRRAERRLAEAQRLAQLGSWEWDVAGGGISWSREMYRIYGEDPQRFVPTPEVLAERLVEEDRGPIEEQVLAVVERGGEFDGFARIERPDGQTRDVRFRGSMVAVPGLQGASCSGSARTSPTCGSPSRPASRRSSTSGRCSSAPPSGWP